MPDGGQVTLRLRNQIPHVIIEVTDTGTGMDNQQRQRCFEPFYTSKGDHSGLGLSVCQAIVHRHNGRLELDTEPSHGTTFRIVLPAAEESARDTLRTRDQHRPLPQWRVLYIDDDVRLHAVVTSILEELGQETDVAANGPTGIAMFEASRYDAVVTDLGMSGLDGRRVVSAVKQLRPDVPVIM